MAVVDLTATREQRQEEAFQRYVALWEIVNRTGAVEDGLAAGRAWRAFLDTFISPAQRKVFERCDRIVGTGRAR